MSRFYGSVGFGKTEKTERGIMRTVYTERKYTGDTISDINRTIAGVGINDDINLSERISIIADLYATENYNWIKYVVINGVKWKVTSVEVKRPRLILSVGGLYNA